MSELFTNLLKTCLDVKYTIVITIRYEMACLMLVTRCVAEISHSNSSAGGLQVVRAALRKV